MGHVTISIYLKNYFNLFHSSLFCQATYPFSESEESQ